MDVLVGAILAGIDNQVSCALASSVLVADNQVSGVGPDQKLHEL